MILYDTSRWQLFQDDISERSALVELDRPAFNCCIFAQQSNFSILKESKVLPQFEFHQILNLDDILTLEFVIAYLKIYADRRTT